MEPGSYFRIDTEDQQSLAPRIIIADALNTFSVTTDPLIDSVAQLGPTIGYGLLPNVEELLKKAAEFGGNTVVTNKFKIERDEEVADLAAAGIKLIAVAAKGTNVVNIASCQRHGITVVNAPTYAPPSVAQHAHAVISGACNRLSRIHSFARAGKVTTGFSYDELEPINLFTSTLGIYGWGQIGQEVGRMFKAAYPTIQVVALDVYDIFGAEVVQPDAVAKDIYELMSSCNIVCLNASLNGTNQHVFTTDVFSRICADNFIFANLARGGLVNEDDLKRALDSRWIDTAAIDTTEDEPLPASHWMRHHTSVDLSLHTAWRNGRPRCIQEVCEGIGAFWTGDPINTVAA